MTRPETIEAVVQGLLSDPETLAMRRAERPDPVNIRAACPCCGSDVVSNYYYTKGKGYILRWDCWEAVGPNPTCTYRRVI